jgi:outer membrane lipoprotein-sorting protein
MNQDNQPILDQLERLRALAPDETESRRVIERARESIVQQPLQTQWYGGKVAMIARIAACIAIISVLGIVPLRTLWQSDSDSRLLAQMVENVRNTKNVSYRTTTTTRETVDGVKQEPTTQVVRVWVTADGLSRVEHDWGLTTITNRQRGRMLEYDRNTKKAHISAPKPQFLNMYEHLKSLDVTQYRKLPEKNIDGRRAAGFVVPAGDKLYGEGVEIWLDVQTKLPIRIVGRSGDMDDGYSITVTDRFAFDDPKVASTRFEITVPEGYVLQDTPVLESFWIDDEGQLGSSEEERAAAAAVLVAGMKKNLQEVKNVSLRFKAKSRSTHDGKKMPFRESSYRGWIDASGSTRQETDHGIISVVNRKEHRVMFLNKNTKKANIVPIPKDEPFDNIYENLKNTDFQNYDKVPEKEIDGKIAVGFVAPPGNAKHSFQPGVTIWVARDTKLPIRIEGSFGTDKDDPDHVFVIDQIVFDDPKVIPSLFEIKVPEGYEVQEEPLLKFTPGTK